MAQENVAVETKEIPLGEASMAEYKQAVKDGKDVVVRETSTTPPEATETTEEHQEQKPKVKGGFQARIDRLIKQQAATEERATAAERKAAELEAKLNQGTVPKSEQEEPKRDDFQTDAEYLRALVKWEAKQTVKAEREAEQLATIEEQIREARSNYNSRMIALQAENEEYKELMQQSIAVPAAIEGPITLEMENGPEVAIFLAQNPDICRELTEMTPSRAVAEVWKISEKLSEAGNEKTDEETDEEKAERERIEAEEAEKEAAAARKKAPAPIRPVSGGSTRSTIPLDKTDFQAYKKLREQGRVR